MSGIPPPDQVTSLPPLTIPFPWNERPETTALPVPLTSFVGREREIDLVIDLLRRPDVRLLTLTGAGGIGKTRLASRIVEHVCNAFRDVFGDGVAFIPLAAIRDPDLVLPTVAQTLGVPDAPGQPVEHRIQAFLADRTMLLVLDNLEHLLVAAPLVVNLLGASPRLTILCTSRTRLDVSGEHVVALEPLTAEAARHLFADRAQALVPAFALTTGLTPIVDAICARLDRLPLAIELAASRIAVLPPRALLARLEHRLDLLTGGPRDAPARLRDMRGAIAWSHELLTEPEQVVFRRLGVFIGGFTLAAAGAVAGEGRDVLGEVSALVGASLVNPMDGVGEEPRFTMLETIREYALERLVSSGEEAETRRRHATHFMRAVEAELPNQDTRELRAAHDRIEADLQNCRAAMEWALESGEAETGIRLAGPLWRTWWYAQSLDDRPWHERMTEGRSWLDRTLRFREGLPVSVLTEALAGAAQLANFQGDHASAQVWAEELLSRAQSESFAYGIYWGAFALAGVASGRRDFVTERSMCTMVIESAPALPRPESCLSQALVCLAQADEHLKDITSARANFEQALVLGRTSGNPHAICLAAFSFGRFMRIQGDLHRASLLLSEALANFLQERHFGGVAGSLAELALVALGSGQPERAIVFLASAHALPFRREPGTDDRPTYDRALGAARDALPDPAFVAAWDAGKAMSWLRIGAEVEALTAALDRPTLDAGSRSPQQPFGLTRRELEVVRMLADGRSNRAIADALSLSERTVENHVLHILTKLELESRTAAATWAVRHGLA